VLSLMEKRGLSLGRDPGDPYAQRLQAHVRQPAQERLLDRLLVSALIEARSEERLRLLGEALPDPELRTFYARLAEAEQGHAQLFLHFAEEAPEVSGFGSQASGQKHKEPPFRARLRELLEIEAELVRLLPLRPAIH
jgi:tRNA-(ms[2]io[6]A)-hydroxylase